MFWFLPYLLCVLLVAVIEVALRLHLVLRIGRLQRVPEVGRLSCATRPRTGRGRCWADGARAGRFAAAELKEDVMSKEFSGMDMVVPRDAASFPSAPSRRHLVHAGTTRRLTGRAVGPIARRPRASSRRSPRSGGRRKPIRGTSMQPPGKYGAPVVSRKSGPVVRLLSCQFTHAPNKHLLLLLLHQRRRPREDAARRRL